MHLVRLSIDALPGIEPGFSFDAASTGVNIVTGPNAVGKTSLVRALGYLLRGAQSDDPPALFLSAEFDSGETRLQVRRSGSQIQWMRNGEPVTPPPLPGADQIGLYRLSVESLLSGDRTDEQLAAELQRTLRGGFDLDELRTEVSPRVGRQQEKALQAARKSLADVESRYENLRRQEAELPALAAQIENAELAGKARERLQTAMQLHEAVEERKRCEGRLAEFPNILEKLTGDELRLADDLESNVATQRAELQKQQGALDSAIADRHHTGLAESCPTAEDVEVIGKRLQQLSINRSRRETARVTLEKAEAALGQAASDFNDAARIPGLDREGLRRAEEIAAPLIAARNRRRELEHRIGLCGAPPDESEIARLQQGSEALRTWLADAARSADSKAANRRSLAVALWAALGASVLAAGLSLWQRDFAALAAALVAASASGAAIFLFLRRWPEVPAVGDEARRAFEETGLPPPSSWSTDAVRETLRSKIETPLSALQSQRERAAEAKGLRVQFEEAAAQANELEAKRQALAEEIGFDPALPLASLDLFLRRCLNLDEAHRRRDEQRAELELIDRDIDSDQVRIAGFLDRWRLPDAAPQAEAGASQDGDLLQASFDALKKRLETADTANERIRAAEGSMQLLQQRIDEDSNGLRRLFDRAGLQQGDRASLEMLVARLDGWKQAGKALDQALGHENSLRAQLEEHAELIHLADRGEEAALNFRLQTALDGVGRHTELVENRKEIETRLDEAGKERQLEQALGALERAREGLAEKLDETLQHTATNLLLDEVEGAFQSQHEPQVLRRATSLFTAATARKFTLKLDQGEFKAGDTQAGGLKSLRQLSSGTRMQLLLALRLAWTEAQEQGGERLPLFLDEALTTSDETRFGVLADSLDKLAAAEGRQIFYLTARRNEAALWHELTGTRPPVVDLAQLRFGKSGMEAEDYRVELPQAMPAPEGMSAEDYAALLGVPPLQPRLPAGTIHLFHLLRDDLDLLHRLMDRWHLSTVGQLENLLHSSAAPGAVADATIRSRLERRCRALRVWLGLWRQGRGQTVDRGVLEQSGAVSARFIDAASELTLECAGNGRALIEALRNGKLRGFRNNKTDELEAWLSAAGFTDERPTLTTEDRRRLTLQSMAPESEATAKDIAAVVNWLEAAGPDDAVLQGGSIALYSADLVPQRPAGDSLQTGRGGIARRRGQSAINRRTDS